MTGTLRLTAIFASVAIVASMSVAANAKTHHHHHYNAYASAAPHQQGQDPMEIRHQCYMEANKRWSTSNQDLQTARQYAYSTCVVEHGVMNP